jgi:hypothetical protein
MMRWLLGGVGALALAAAVGACAAIAGLSPYSSADCPAEGCDAGSHPKPHDGTVATDDGPAVSDDAGPAPADDGATEAGCPDGLLECDGGCASPTAATSCGSCDVACEGDAGLCAAVDAGSFGCVSSCPASTPTNCNGTCTNTITDPNNCGGCGSAFACTPGQACIGGVCMTEGGGDAGDGGGVTCPDGGCPSVPTGYSCSTLGTCNAASNQCDASGGCYCHKDTDCKSQKCVKVARENDVSCGSNCTGSGSRDGYDCELASPGIPSLGTGSSYACPAGSGYKGTNLSCDPTHTNCYCTADNQCTSGKCVPSSNNGCTSPACTGSGAADYRGCQTIASVGNCPIYIGCPIYSVCQYPVCYCNNDLACDSGHCIPSSRNGNCTNCTGTGADDGHGCQPPPSSVACVGTGGTVCTTTLTPPPVINAGKTACLCVADSNCSSGKCINKDSQCTGTCTGSGTPDSEDCETATTVANMWSCAVGNCSNVSSPTGMCSAAGVPCWCTSDSQCPGGTQCASWSGCASGACTGSGAADSFHCAP